MQDSLKIPVRRSWQHCQERFHADASHIGMDRITIGDTGSSSALGTSTQ